MAEDNFHSEWMAFSSWYSLHKEFPDAEFFINFRSLNHYSWIGKANIKKYRSMSYPTIIVPAGILAVRSNLPNGNFTDKNRNVWLLMDSKDYQETDELCSDCQEERITPFLSVDACGSYNKKTWIEKSKFAPFNYNFKTISMTQNEKLVLSLWKETNKLYSLLVGVPGINHF